MFAFSPHLFSSCKLSTPLAVLVDEVLNQPADQVAGILSFLSATAYVTSFCLFSVGVVVKGLDSRDKRDGGQGEIVVGVWRDMSFGELSSSGTYGPLRQSLGGFECVRYVLLLMGTANLKFFVGALFPLVSRASHHGGIIEPDIMSGS